MIPRTLSASSLSVAQLCMARWKAENVEYTPGVSNNAAKVGSAFHGGAEKYVEAVYIDKTKNPSLDFLIACYDISYMQVFGSTDTDTEEYADGLNLTKRWFKRTDFSGRTVVSVEKKESFLIPYIDANGNKQTLPFVYIIDRLDLLDDGTIEVVDYKSVRMPISPEDLETKLQARIYAFAVQIMHPEAQRIKVTFDLLRHEPVSIYITREENTRFWGYLKKELQRIVDTDEANVRPTLNSDCGYCVIKYTCPLMQKNLAAGGIHSLGIDESAILLQNLRDQMSANKRIISDLEERIYEYAADSDSLEWATENDSHDIEIRSGRSRSFDTQKAAMLIGPELFAQLGNMTLGKLDDLIKDESIDPDVRKQLKALITTSNGSLKINIKTKKPF